LGKYNKIIIFIIFSLIKIYIPNDNANISNEKFFKQYCRKVV